MGFLCDQRPLAGTAGARAGRRPAGGLLQWQRTRQLTLSRGRRRRTGRTGWCWRNLSGLGPVPQGSQGCGAAGRIHAILTAREHTRLAMPCFYGIMVTGLHNLTGLAGDGRASRPSQTISSKPGTSSDRLSPPAAPRTHPDSEPLQVRPDRPSGSRHCSGVRRDPKEIVRIQERPDVRRLRKC